MSAEERVATEAGRPAEVSVRDVGPAIPLVELEWDCGDKLTTAAQPTGFRFVLGEDSPDSPDDENTESDEEDLTVCGFGELVADTDNLAAECEAANILTKGRKVRPPFVMPGIAACPTHHGHQGRRQDYPETNWFSDDMLRVSYFPLDVRAPPPSRTVPGPRVAAMVIPATPR